MAFPIVATADVFRQTAAPAGVAIDAVVAAADQDEEVCWARVATIDDLAAAGSDAAASSAAAARAAAATSSEGAADSDAAVVWVVAVAVDYLALVAGKVRFAALSINGGAASGTLA